ncbi:MAG: alternative ribosome rescue aminoacyl-tRNA hydrolase ArfB [Minisyncoccia bacterium]
MENIKFSSEKQNFIPEEEIEWQFSRSSSKGGQNVNKVETKVEIHWNINNSKAFSEEEKERIKKVLASKINQAGDLIIRAEEERSQLQNKKIALEKLNEFIQNALQEEEKRIPTKIPKSSQNERLKEKKIISEKKKLRNKNINLEEE